MKTLSLSLMNAVLLAILLACKGPETTVPTVQPPVVVAPPVSTTTVPGVVTPVARKLVWADEFDKNGLPDSTKWGYDVGGNGWGNNELQFYTKERKENARIEKGNLIIEAHKESYQGRNYTSARLLTQKTATWRYGRMEVRAKLPSGLGTWPAIWMLGENIPTAGWPLCGEIDIMEHVGYEEGVVHGTLHTEAYNHGKGTQKEGKTTVPTATSAFHVYAIDWTRNQIDFYVDDQKYYSMNAQTTGGTQQQWPFTQPFFMILNLAVGGNWGGQKGVDERIWPQRMEVDYVRVYQ
ncbi:glycoside hydrolase family 16 protein [Spirosoma utsteinense]|uniref:Beta-glucanase (GH16 family) n=1 Tax=Spirosoma utsteinense TaxID=2585773 RepID=A0ABR6W5K8_9BACT|nr:glycoside hydrolase family 16 protein [Spirosoma utsteinense]MBC3786262.1 beta-glucanase (GH16 family) [Spirosoma utsteinense]MBC3791888.1 beta-glucanase (GH16 family) [Spirosoma utsteinense]